jgi:LETM1 and EF-hand domain-containing protein 1, mitochondrial
VLRPKAMLQQFADWTISLGRTILIGLFVRLPKATWHYIQNPSDFKAQYQRLKQVAKDELHHYWVGTKLLVADVRTARDLTRKTLHGNALTRRERNQLLRTVADLFRLIPFSMFLIIPLAEFALPFALKIFPNLLPSTFQDSLKAEENMKRELQSRLAMAQFFQETLEELAKEQKRKARKARKDSSSSTATSAAATTTSDSGSSSSSSSDTSSSSSSLLHDQEDSAASMLDFLQKARNGEMLESSVIIRYAKYFQDDLTLDNMPRMQLMNMCKYMNIAPYGNDSFLRFQLRHRIRILKEDDQRILWEGIESLTKMELREACQERGMRSTGLSKDAYKYALQQWLDLSVQKNVSLVFFVVKREIGNLTRVVVGYIVSFFGFLTISF